MKKITALAAIYILLMTLVFPVRAAGETLHMTDVQGTPGDTVQIRVTVQESIQGNAMGITYAYDNALLQVLPDQCSWSRKGTLQDFGSKQDGVWAVNDPVDLKGEVCVLTFRILEDAVFDKTQISCTLIVKNGAKEVGTFQAASSLTKPCEHSFEQWKDSGELGHSRICSLCGAGQTQSHSWEEGTVTQDPENPSQGIRVSTCSLCGGTRTERAGEYIPERTPTEPEHEHREEEPTRPTQPRPEPTYPTEEEPPREEPATRPTENSGNQDSNPGQTDREPENIPGGDNRPQENGAAAEGHTGHDHLPVNPEEETMPMVISIEGWTGDPEETVAEEEIHDHDHDHETAENKGGGAVFLVTLAALAAVGAWLYKKTKRR